MNRKIHILYNKTKQNKSQVKLILKVKKKPKYI